MEIVNGRTNEENKGEGKNVYRRFIRSSKSVRTIYVGANDECDTLLYPEYTLNRARVCIYTKSRA